MPFSLPSLNMYHLMQHRSASSVQINEMLQVRVSSSCTVPVTSAQLELKVHESESNSLSIYQMSYRSKCITLQIMDYGKCVS